jgi:hypothetical protein
VPELAVISQRLLQEATAWDSSAGVTDLMLHVEASHFSAEIGHSGVFSSTEIAHLTTLLHQLTETVSLPIGLQLAPKNSATAIALWQLGVVEWVALAPFHQGVLHPHFGFVSPYPLETLFQTWHISETATHWLVVDLQHWTKEAILHHWHYLQQHPWVKALSITLHQAKLLREQGLWLAEHQPPCWLVDAPIDWLETQSDWLLPQHNPAKSWGVALHQLALRPLQTAEPWPYATDTTDPKRIEGYQQQLNQWIAHRFPPEIPSPKATLEAVPEAISIPQKAKCPFGFGQKR